MFPWETSSTDLFGLLWPIRKEIMFQTGTDKVVDRTLNDFPVSAMIAQHQPVNCQAPVHLEGKDSFRLLECQETMRHQIGHIRLLADIRQFAE